MVVRRDGARGTYGFRQADDPERVCDVELAGRFDADLDVLVIDG